MDKTSKAPAAVAACVAQENALVLEHLNAADAMGIGQSILALALDWFPGRPIAIHIEKDTHPLFVYFMDGTGAGNADWVNKKKNVVHRFGHSSWTVQQQCRERGVDFNQDTGLDPDLYRAEGGAFPLVVRGQGRIGTVIVSGLEGWEDHVLAVAGLELWLGHSSASPQP
jgi:uncharacterized protein (UPF0303 family)